MIDIGGITSYVSIVIICYLIGAGCKACKKIKNNDIIPIICGVAGGILGVVAYVCKVPTFPAQDVLMAVAIGIICGLSATGVKELTKLFLPSSSDSATPK